MLIFFKNKLQKIASITLALFVGSWLLFLCQTCMASVNPSQQHHQAVTDKTMSCHESVPVNHEDKVSHKHCLGVCNCDTVVATLNSEIKSEPVNKIKYIPDLYVYIVPDITPSSKAPPVDKIPPPPERAIHLPFNTYNVLLI